MTTWEALFERASGGDVTVEDVRDALDAQRDGTTEKPGEGER